MPTSSNDMETWALIAGRTYPKMIC